MNNRAVCGSAGNVNMTSYTGHYNNTADRLENGLLIDMWLAHVFLNGEERLPRKLSDQGREGGIKRCQRGADNSAFSVVGREKGGWR